LTQLVRIPLAWPIGTRSGTSLAKDPYIRNGILERYGDKMYVMKRPGSVAYKTIGSGSGNLGFFYFNGFFYTVVNQGGGDTLFRDSGTTASGTTAATWSSAQSLLSGSPNWPATTAQNAVVFQDKIFMIGGFSSEAGIWSTQDGLTWAVAAGGQPWGLRDQQGLVAFQNKMWILGGLNLTTVSVFNDVWNTEDGTNWTLISPDTSAITMWNARCAHCAVASNNGIYIYGGQDLVPNYFSDVWYSSDGLVWNQISTAAGWTARSNAGYCWFNNKLWIVGGYNGSALNDVWSSPDGITWNQETAAAFGGGGRYSFFFTVYAGKMWVIGGNTGGAVTKEIYSSADGKTWTLVTSNPGFTAREGSACVVFKTPYGVSPYRYETIWILGGDDGATSLQQVYYGNLDVITSTSYALNPTVAGQPYQFATFNNGTQLCLKNQTNFWVLQSGTLTKVTDPNYPPVTVPGIATLNGFLYVGTPDGQIISCDFDDPLTWPGLNSITAEYEDDGLVAVAKYLNYVVALGQWTTQFFYDNGANQPVGTALAPYINANMRMGCCVAQSVANVDNNLYFVAQTQNGDRSVVMLSGLQIQELSNEYINKILMVTPTSFLQGFNYSIGGHQYYVLKAGNSSALVYDTDEKQWYEWDTFPYLDSQSDLLTFGTYLMGLSGGVIVQATSSQYTDNSVVFTMSCQTDKEDHGNTALKYFGYATVVGDQNAFETVDVAGTDDDYQTYTTYGTADMSLTRPRIWRLGAARRRSWKLSQTDAFAARWEALEVQYSQGES
jgi:hypothetical protein